MQHRIAHSNSPNAIRLSNAFLGRPPVLYLKRHFLLKFIVCFFLCWMSNATLLLADTEPSKITAACNPTDYNNVSNKQMITISSAYNTSSGSYPAALDGGTGNAYWVQRNHTIDNQNVFAISIS